MSSNLQHGDPSLQGGEDVNSVRRSAAVSEKPILFPGPMVHAILAGRKTQTRRVIKPQPIPSDDLDEDGGVVWNWPPDGVSKLGHGHSWVEGSGGVLETSMVEHCPYGLPGDLLVPLTTWAVGQRYDNHKPTELPSDVAFWSGWDSEPEDLPPGKRRPGRFMPKSLRHNLPRLLVVDVRVERLQEISAADCIAEGVERLDKRISDVTVISRLRRLWDSINAKPKPVYQDKKIVSYVSYPWEDIRETQEHRGKPWRIVGNPFCWTVCFERAE